MIESYFHLQDHKSLEAIMEQLDDNDPLLKYIAKIFTAEGDYSSAIRAYLKVVTHLTLNIVTWYDFKIFSRLVILMLLFKSVYFIITGIKQFISQRSII